MDEILNDIDAVFRTISSIPVAYDSVDSMAVARAQLRGLRAKIENMETEVKEDGK